MKIITLVWSIGIGGTERGAVNYAIGYKKFGHDSRVIVLGEGYERYTDLQAANVETTLICKSLKTKENIFNEFKIWQPEIIHVHNYTDDILLYINLIRNDHTKVVETNVFSRPNYSLNYQAVDLSMQLSNWGYWKYTRWMKGAKYTPEVAVVPYVVDSTKFIEPTRKEINNYLLSKNIPLSAFVVGRLGQAHPSKWDSKIIDVIKNTIHTSNNIYYFFVGLPTDLKSLINKQSPFFNSRVIQIEKIEGDKNLSLYYHSLNCFAHISKIGESFGYVLAEVLLCKVPVISMLTPFHDNAQLEIIGNGFGGFCTANSKNFINKINLLHEDKVINDVLKKNLNGWIVDRFSYEAIIPTQIKIYEVLLGNNKISKLNVDNTIENNFKLFYNKEFIIKFVTKIINTYHFLQLVQLSKKIRYYLYQSIYNNKSDC